MSTPARILQALHSPDTTQPFQRLVPFNWRGELLVNCLGMLASFLVAGFWYPYWRIVDMDFWVVYNAFLLNVPLPHEYFDHPGYLSIVLLSYWLRALHSLGIVHVLSLSEVPPVADAVGFARAWTGATQAGRVLSLIYAMGFVLTFSYLLRALVRDWRIAAFGGFLLAFSGGMAMETRILRTELLAAAFFTSALLMLLVVAMRGDRWWRPAMIGAASLLITLALLNKIQFLLLFCALPILLLPFGPEAPLSGFWSAPRLASGRSLARDRADCDLSRQKSVGHRVLKLWHEPPIIGAALRRRHLLARTRVLDRDRHGRLCVVLARHRRGDIGRDVRRGRRLLDRIAGALHTLSPKRRRHRLPSAGTDVHVGDRLGAAARDRLVAQPQAP